ncbi:hypothetical protein DKT74_14285 [Streptomyces sp. ZEA17I]|uniref:hypothetical protein n=1 Tax=Streptomyces sp. ZEA17I TaxID=2202516 RepID=UPI000D6FD714|nr:hypothetical protein [Streptomyces sp. ZEA17I]PWS43904.1 hypothetical protein DKT74_14285 [Streptomyces sp. ZEA17I]
MRKPPPPGKGLSVRMDAELYDDLTVMMSTGITASDAVKHAVSLVAQMYSGAWEEGLVPEGEQPRIDSFNASRYDT